MGAKKQTVDAAAAFIDEISPARDVQQVQNVQPEQDVQEKERSRHKEAGEKRSIKYKSGGRQTVHVHTLLFADDLNELKAIAREKSVTEGRTIGVNEMLRDIVAEYVKKHRKA